MQTLLIRHRKENRKKCSLTPLEKNKNFTFLTYPLKDTVDTQGYLTLSLEGPELSYADRDYGLVILDGLWRYIPKMSNNIPSMETRTLPKEFRTAYPRRQDDCVDPMRGLASIEALYIAYTILGKETEGMLDQYYFKDAFLEKNADLLQRYRKNEQ